MKKITLMAAVLCSLLHISCKKGAGTSTPTPVSTYYFEFTFGGKAVTFASQDPDCDFVSPGDAGGSQTPSDTIGYPDISIKFQFNHPPSDAEVKGLAGKRVVFSFDNADSVTAHLRYGKNNPVEEFYQDRSVNSDNYIQVDKVTFVKSKSSLGLPIDIYEIRGTCRSKMSRFDGSNEQMLENGHFNTLIARRTDLDGR